MKSRQLGEKRALEGAQKTERMAPRRQHLKEAKREWVRRRKAKAKGLAAFLGSVTGMDIVVKKIRKINDQRRLKKYQVEKQKLVRHQARGMGHLHEHHRMQFLDVKRLVWPPNNGRITTHC